MATQERTKTVRSFDRPGGDALDLLEAEDIELRRVFAAIEEAGTDSVGGRALYGDLAKEIIHRMATREAALVEVARLVDEVPELGSTPATFDPHPTPHRQLLDRLEKMSRGVQAINLNTGQEFDQALQELIEVVTPDIERDLAVTIPEVRSWLSKSGEDDPLRSAGYVVRHAPTNLSPDGPRWYERAPVISRFLTIYDRLRDFPGATRRH